ncbi:hypothetical protein DFH08DRAFT_864493 [Mycena albidolilacea]|uniref:Secreted protein n=1 Tax=Mycena albidolilacea TaxID=1033008 RepID=A0AAD7A438_9AGAR|nr:hypothetical protein DFH08DRAFT_864493 [Mycena albidolilacea]
MVALWILFATLCWPARVAPSLTGELGSFASPKTGVKWRYWIEDASASPDILRADVAEMASVGSSGFELLSYQSYGGEAQDTGNILLDPTDFAFGSDNFVDVTAVLVGAAMDNNITIDFSMGPDQGAGVPVFPDDVDMEGMNTELVFGSHFLGAGETFSGPLPNPMVFPMVSGLDNQIDSANITTMRLVSAVIAELIPGANSSASRVSLDWNTVQDLTSQVDNSSSISFTAPNASSVLLAYYSRRNGFPEARRGFNGSFLDEPGSWGSWVVDHFSAKGANVSISFIEQNILARDNIGAMAAQPGVGSYMWEDSMEFFAQLFWTDAFPQRFTERHGYEINKTLPVLHTLPNRGPKANQTFDFGSTVTWQKFLEDYQDTLTSLYIDYMTTFREWSHTIGFQFSNQPGYNFRLDVAASAAIPDAPEIESLGVPTIDEARQLSGGVHLGNRTIFSSETGANPGETYTIRMPELLLDAKTQYAGGVNVALLHGFPYSGAYPGTTWPGIVTFGYRFADMHGPRMPAWDYYKEYLDFLKRTQYTLQSGIAKVDVAIYRKDYDITGSPPFRGNSLVNAGYTYEYVSPENLKLPGVSVSNGRLAAGGPAYKAFVLNRGPNITVDAAQKLLDYARAGLPIVISGGVPNDIPGFETDGAQQAQVQDLMQQLLNETNVKVVVNETQVPGALSSFGVLPAASVSTPLATIYAIRRDVPDASYFYLFNSGNTTENFTLSLRTDIPGTPFFLDAFTGKVSPVALWTNDSGAISIPSLSLAPTESALFAVSSADTFEGVGVPNVHLSALDSPAVAVGNANGSIEVQSTSDGVFNYTLSTGDTGSVNVTLSGETTRTLSGWQLSIVAWTPPQNLSSIEPVLVPQPVFNLTQGLVPWNTLAGQANTSGVGTYNTTFDWDAHSDTVGPKLNFGTVFHTIKAFVNDVQIPTADPTSPIVDITQFVATGSNTLRVEAASTLLNAVNAVPQIASLGFRRTQTGIIPANQAYGLVAPVQLIPYGRASISL